MTITSFNELEILKIACAIEEEGNRFYSEIASKFEDQNIKKIFNFLADEEKEHIDIFQKIYNKALENTEENKDDYLYGEEVALYLKAISETAIFNTNGLTNYRVSNVATAKEALLIGIQAEKDAILFYETISKNTKLESTKNAVDALVSEEVEHLHKLRALIDNID